MNSLQNRCPVFSVYIQYVILAVAGFCTANKEDFWQDMLNVLIFKKLFMSDFGPGWTLFRKAGRTGNNVSRPLVNDDTMLLELAVERGSGYFQRLGCQVFVASALPERPDDQLPLRILEGMSVPGVRPRGLLLSGRRPGLDRFRQVCRHDLGPLGHDHGVFNDIRQFPD